MTQKSAILLKPVGTIIQENYLYFYTSEPFRILRFNMRHPVFQTNMNQQCFGLITLEIALEMVLEMDLEMVQQKISE